MKTPLPVPFVMWEDHVRFSEEEDRHSPNAALKRGRAVILGNPTSDNRNRHEVPYMILFELEDEKDLLGKMQWRRIATPFVEFMSWIAKDFLNKEKGEPA